LVIAPGAPQSPKLTPLPAQRPSNVLQRPVAFSCGLQSTDVSVVHFTSQNEKLHVTFWQVESFVLSTQIVVFSLAVHVEFTKHEFTPLQPEVGTSVQSLHVAPTSCVPDGPAPRWAKAGATERAAAAKAPTTKNVPMAARMKPP
jgi:hypothetical protein